MQPPEALQQAKDWLRELTNGKLGEWYAGELLPLLRETDANPQNRAKRLLGQASDLVERVYRLMF